LVMPSKGCSHVNQITHESIFSRNRYLHGFLNPLERSARAP
jgi:hypothetical protein